MGPGSGGGEVSLTLLDGTVVTIAAPGAEVRIAAPSSAVQANNAPHVTIGAGAAELHNQAAPAATWTISHSLDRRPAVTVYLATGEEVFADVTADTTQVVITFASPQAGQAILT